MFIRKIFISIRVYSGFKIFVVNVVVFFVEIIKFVFVEKWLSVFSGEEQWCFFRDLVYWKLLGVQKDWFVKVWNYNEKLINWRKMLLE